MAKRRGKGKSKSATATLTPPPPGDEENWDPHPDFADEDGNADTAYTDGVAISSRTGAHDADDVPIPDDDILADLKETPDDGDDLPPESIAGTRKASAGTRTPEEPEASDEGDDTFSPDLLAKAGLTAEQASKHFDDDEGLQAYLELEQLRYGQRMLQHGQQLHQQPEPQFQQPPQQYPSQAPPQAEPRGEYPVGAPPQQPVQPQYPQGYKPPKFEFNADEVADDPEKFVETFKKANDFYAEELAKRDMAMARLLQMQQAGYSQVAVINQAVAAERTRQLDEWFESKFKGLGNEYEDVFGKGNTWNLQSGSSERANRERVVQAMNTMNAGIQANGHSPMTMDDLFDTAVKVSFADKTEELLQGKVLGRAQRRQKNFIARPTHRKSAPMKPLERAAKASEDFDRKVFGMSPDNEPDIPDEI